MAFTLGTTGGYSSATFNNSIAANAHKYLLLGQGLEKVPRFENNRPVKDTVDKTRVEMYFEGLGTLKVSLPAEYKLPKISDLTQVELDSAEAFVNQKGILYVRAQGIHEA